MDNIVYKWLELNIVLTDESKFNQVLKELVAPYIKRLYKASTFKTWHYFREPNLRWRICGEEYCINFAKKMLDELLSKYERTKPKIYKSHFFGEHGVIGKEYHGEQELYGNDAWELCYKRWEAGSNLALLLCTSTQDKSLPFYYTRDIHLFENQLGFDYADAIVMYLKWIKILMNCDPEKRFDKYTDTICSIIKETYSLAKIDGV
jgi:hypothetical protein